MTVFPEELYAHILAQYTVDDFYNDPSTALERRLEEKVNDYPYDPWPSDEVDNCKSYFHHFARLCLVSKTFQRLAQPILYRTYVLSSRQTDRPNTGLTLFLRSLIENPVLRSLVEIVSTGHWSTEWDEEHCTLNEPAPPTEDVIAVYNSITAKTPLDWLLPPLKRGREDAAICLVIAMCPNIRLLSIDKSLDFSNTCLLRLIRQHWELDSENIDRGTGEPHPPLPKLDLPKEQRILRNLETLCIRHQSDKNSSDFADVVPFMNLPKIKRIYGRQFSTHEEPLGPTLPPTRSSNLSHLHLELSLWDISSMASILGACRNIETLELSGGEAMHGDMELDIPGIGNILREHANGIKRLLIDPRETDDGNEYGIDNLGRLGDLKSLNQLKYVIAPLFTLIDEKTLPLQRDYVKWTTVRVRDGVGINFGPSVSMVAAHKALLSVLPDSIKEVTVLEDGAPTSVVMAFKPLGIFTVKHVVDDPWLLSRIEKPDLNYV